MPVLHLTKDKDGHYIVKVREWRRRQIDTWQIKAAGIELLRKNNIPIPRRVDDTEKFSRPLFEQLKKDGLVYLKGEGHHTDEIVEFLPQGPTEHFSPPLSELLCELTLVSPPALKFTLSGTPLFEVGQDAVIFVSAPPDTAQNADAYEIQVEHTGSLVVQHGQITQAGGYFAFPLHAIGDYHIREKHGRVKPLTLTATHSLASSWSEQVNYTPAPLKLIVKIGQDKVTYVAFDAATDQPRTSDINLSSFGKESIPTISVICSIGVNVTCSYGKRQGQQQGIDAAKVENYLAPHLAEAFKNQEKLTLSLEAGTFGCLDVRLIFPSKVKLPIAGPPPQTQSPTAIAPSKVEPPIPVLPPRVKLPVSSPPAKGLSSIPIPSPGVEVVAPNLPSHEEPSLTDLPPAIVQRMRWLAVTVMAHAQRGKQVPLSQRIRKTLATLSDRPDALSLARITHAPELFVPHVNALAHVIEQYRAGMKKYDG